MMIPKLKTTAKQQCLNLAVKRPKTARTMIMIPNYDNGPARDLSISFCSLVTYLFDKPLSSSFVFNEFAKMFITTPKIKRRIEMTATTLEQVNLLLFE